LSSPISDEWKVLPNLTLNLGIRWEYYSPANEVLNRTRVFDLENCQGICPPGSPLYFPSYRNFDPRFGLAWSPTQKTVIRGGFGVYHGAGQNDDLNAGLESDNIRISLSSADVPAFRIPSHPSCQRRLLTAKRRVPSSESAVIYTLKSGTVDPASPSPQFPASDRLHG